MTQDDEQDLDDEDEFADEDEPIDIDKETTPEYVAWLNKVSTFTHAIDEYHWLEANRLRDLSSHYAVAAGGEADPHLAMALRIISEATLDLGREHMIALSLLSSERAPVKHRPWHDR